MPVKTLSERVTPFVGARVDAAAGVIRDAVICGHASANRRDYLPTSFGTGKQYEGRQSFLDHDEAGRSVESLIGWWTGVGVRDGKPRGDFNLVKSHPLANFVLEVAERNPGLLGFSHVARCRTRPGADGREVVEAVEEVESIDLVAQPATTKGFFESRKGGVPVATFRDVVESVRPRIGDAAKAKRVRQWLMASEDDAGMSAMLDAPAELPGDDADPDEALWGGFQAAINAVLTQYATDGDAEAAVKQIGKYVKAHAKLSKADAGAEDAKAEESKPATPAPDTTREAIEVCRKVGWKGFDADDLDLVALAPAERREAVARRLMGAATTRHAETPVSLGRHGAEGFGLTGGTTTTTAAESKVGRDAVWADN